VAESLPKIAVLFSGAGSNLAAIVEVLHAKTCEVVCALTNNPQAGGIEIASRAAIACEVIPSKREIDRDAYDAMLIEALCRYKPDLVVMAGFMRIVTPLFVRAFRAINLHPSLLPRHKGMAAIQKSYEDAFPTGGVSVHWVTEALDGGEVILQREVAKAGLSYEAYEATIRQIEKEVLIEAIKILLK
jgi:phosphoribosylglycinamide formyltransferase-1